MCRLVRLNKKGVFIMKRSLLTVKCLLNASIELD